jgi:hypothetical protein
MVVVAMTIIEEVAVTMVYNITIVSVEVMVFLQF